MLILGSSSWDTSASEEEEKIEGRNRPLPPKIQQSNSNISKKYANLQKRKRKSSSDSSSSSNLEMELTNSLKLKRPSTSNVLSISDESNVDDIPDLDKFTDSSVPMSRPSSRKSNDVKESLKRHKKNFSKASCDHSAFKREIHCLQNENEGIVFFVFSIFP